MIFAAEVEFAVRQDRRRPAGVMQRRNLPAGNFFAFFGIRFEHAKKFPANFYNFWPRLINSRRRQALHHRRSWSLRHVQTESRKMRRSFPLASSCAALPLLGGAGPVEPQTLPPQRRSSSLHRPGEKLNFGNN